jgi:hypothetical protein
MRPLTTLSNNMQAALSEIQAASTQNDIVDIANSFSITGTFTETYDLNLTSPTAANIAAVLATLITVMQRGGLNRTS